jgi:sugar lactone lactonase YvrE
MNSSYCVLVRFLLAVIFIASHSTLAFAFGTALPRAWSITIPNFYEPDVSPAPHGDIYVTAKMNWPYDDRLFRIDSDGTQLWSHLFDGNNSPTGVATDPQGNAIVVGQNLDQAFVSKIKHNGVASWLQPITGPLRENPNGVAVDADGNSYVSIAPWATNYGTPPPGTFHNLQKYSPTGQLEWLTEFDTLDGTYPGNGIRTSNGTAIDGNGDVVSMFNNYSMANSPDLNSYLTKTTPNGDVVWLKDLGSWYNVFSIDVDSQNNIYAVVNNRILKFDQDGNEVWSIPNEPGISPNLFSLTIGSNDRIFVAGSKTFSSYVAEYDVTGTLLWSELQAPGPNLRFFNTGLTIAGRQVISAYTVAINGANSATMLTAYTLIPEPSTVGLLMLAMTAITMSRHGKVFA